MALASPSSSEPTIVAAAEKALRELGKPTHLRRLREYIQEHGYFAFGAKDPDRALGVQLDRHSKGISVSHAADPQLFYRASPATYGLLEWLSDDELGDIATDEKIAADAESDALDSSLIKEQELHEWLHKNLLENGLIALGLGPLKEWDPKIQSSRRGKYKTGIVGEIDMLLRNQAGDVVILELKRRGDDQTVGQICRYYSWVKETLCPPAHKVMGIILAQEVSKGLEYALRAVSSDIQVRQLQFDVRILPRKN